jgi:hypothetical protein
LYPALPSVKDSDGPAATGASLDALEAGREFGDVTERSFELLRFFFDFFDDTSSVDASEIGAVVAGGESSEKNPLPSSPTSFLSASRSICVNSSSLFPAAIKMPLQYWRRTFGTSFDASLAPGELVEVAAFSSALSNAEMTAASEHFVHPAEELHSEQEEDEEDLEMANEGRRSVKPATWT